MIRPEEGPYKHYSNAEGREYLDVVHVETPIVNRDSGV